eukprot:586213-Rhodomonas_salina.2
MEEATGHGGEDPLDEQRFCEECQLVIARHAFPNQTGSKGSQAWKDILWVPKAATGITAMMNRRLRGMQMMMEKAIAADFRSKVTAELDQLRSMAIVHEEEAKTAVLAKGKYVGELESKELELSRFRAELAEHFNKIVQIKTEAEESRAELKRQRSIAEESVQKKELAEATIKLVVLPGTDGGSHTTAPTKSVSNNQSGIKLLPFRVQLRAFFGCLVLVHAWVIPSCFRWNGVARPSKSNTRNIRTNCAEKLLSRIGLGFQTLEARVQGLEDEAKEAKARDAESK